MIHAMEEPIQEDPGTLSAIGWYVHLPFCRVKCGYCDFYSLPTIAELIDDLVDAIGEEIRRRDPQRPVETVFIGGGTPTELSPPALQSILRSIADRLGRVAEWTVEANPTSTDELKLDALIRAGVNRISFGAQSFRPEELRVLDRHHDPRHIGVSVRAARRAGFDNLNLDLIFGIPGQSLSGWRDTLTRALDLGPDHLSCYALMYEEGTALTQLRRKGRIIPCDDDLEADMFELTIEQLTSAGFDHYEISNFALPGRQCRANVIYWENREYLGIGPSAVSYLDGIRCKNVADVRAYVERMRSDPAAVQVEGERLSPPARAGETAVQMLRLSRGIRVDRFSLLTGYDPRTLFAAPIEALSEQRLLQADEHSIRLTRRGMLLANHVMREFLVDEKDINRTPVRTGSASSNHPRQLT